LQEVFAMCKLFSLFVSNKCSFKYIFKKIMKISMNLEACCFNFLLFYDILYAL
jgi:hypothetical protein